MIITIQWVSLHTNVVAADKRMCGCVTMMMVDLANISLSPPTYHRDNSRAQIFAIDVRPMVVWLMKSHWPYVTIFPLSTRVACQTESRKHFDILFFLCASFLCVWVFSMVLPMVLPALVLCRSSTMTRWQTWKLWRTCLRGRTNRTLLLGKLSANGELRQENCWAMPHRHIKLNVILTSAKKKMKFSDTNPNRNKQMMHRIAEMKT